VIGALVVALLLALGGAAAPAPVRAYPSGQLDLTVPPGSSVEAFVAVHDLQELRDVDVAIDLGTTRAATLRIAIVHPSGASVDLLERAVESPPFMSPLACRPWLRVDDEELQGALAPLEPLAQLDHRNARGTWRLRIENRSPTAVTVRCFQLDLAASSPLVLRRGVGSADWRLASRRRVAPGKIRTEVHADADGPGCIGGPPLAYLVDYYAGLRLSWDRYAGRTSLTEIATTRTGDRSADGSTIGKTTFAAVRKRYPRALTYRGNDRYALGARAWSVYRSTGYESGFYTSYWFDRAGVLVGIATGASGC
jgi:subtilisin-like proprotein convertase family protein